MEENKLPKKTKIAAWFMIICGIGLPLLGLAIFVLGLIQARGYEYKEVIEFQGIVGFICGILFFILGYFLLRKKRRAHKFSLILSWIIIITALPMYFIGIFVFIFLWLMSIPLIYLLTSSREEFFKIAS